LIQKRAEKVEEGELMKIRLFIKPYCGWCHKAMRWSAENIFPLSPVQFVS
jgi:hypothetical protein